jgi:WD40 repeat protein/serine/threonine protein kinase
MIRPAAPLEATADRADTALAELVEQFTARLEAGEVIDVETFALAHPDHAEELRRLLPALQALGELEKSAGARIDAGSGSDDQPGRLGDYRILREVGRGGMGVVYEAEQVSLARHVAVKVLPFAAALDPRHLQRFKNEAQAAAHLHHTNIVPVYAVGHERGVHYYAMQFIEGQTLAGFIQGLRRPVASRDATAGGDPTGPRAPADQAPTDPPAGFATDRSTLEPVYFRTVAGLGLQAAEALAYAHEQGVTHRDVKPANLMVDARGHLWVTDFGLAQCQQSAGLTMTGDLVGTLRYMSPEQALAQRGGTDQRTDIYSLGATLYELLTLEPAFDGSDRQELLRKIAFEDPRAPRQVNRAVPYELETIVLRAMAKSPADRYATAQDLADDLRRFLEHRPILARRPSLLQRLALWARRHRGIVVPAVIAAFVALAVTATALIVSNVRISDALAKQQLAASEKDEALKEKTAALESVTEARNSLQTALDDVHKQKTGRELALSYHSVALADRELRANYVNRAEEALHDCPAEWRRWEWHYLKRLCHTELAVVNAPEWVSGVVAFAAGGTICLAPFQRGARVWAVSADGEAPRLLQTIRASPQAGPEIKPNSIIGRYGVAVSPDGTRVALVNSASPLAVWDVRQGTQLFALPASAIRPGLGYEALLAARAGSPVAFSPDGKLVAAGSSDRLFVCDAATGRPLPVRYSPAGPLWSLAINPDGTRLACVVGAPNSKATARLELLDLTTGQRVASLRGHTGFLRSLTFSPDGRLLAAACDDTSVRVWSMSPAPQDGDREKVLCLGHTRGVNSVCFSPDGKHLASAGMDRTVRVWDVSTGKELLTLRGHVAAVNSVTYADNGQRLISLGADRMMRVWDARAATNPRTVPAHLGTVLFLKFSADGARLVTADARETKTWDTATYRQTAAAPRPNVIPYDAAFMADGRCLVLGRPGGDRRGLVVADAATGKEESHLTTAEPTPRAALSPDGKWIAVSPASANGDARRVRIYDAATGREVRALAGAASSMLGITFSPDGGRLAAALDKSIRVWDTASGEIVGTLEGHSQNVRVLTFQPGGRILASAGDVRAGAAELKLWDLATGKEIAPLRGHSTSITTLAFSPDGTRLASASSDGNLTLWDTTTGRELLALNDTGTTIPCLAFSPDGRHLVSGDARGALTLRDGSPTDDEPRAGAPPAPEDAVPSDP